MKKHKRVDIGKEIASKVKEKFDQVWPDNIKDKISTKTLFPISHEISKKIKKDGDIED